MERNGLELIGRVMRHQRVTELPWLDLAGVHTACIKKYGMRRILEDEELLFSSLVETNRADHPDGQAVCFDVTILPEVLGCELSWSEEDTPCVTTHPLSDTDKMPDFNVKGNEGRIPSALAAVKRLKEEAGEDTALAGLVCGPFTLACHLRGEKLFEDIKENPEYVKRLLHGCTKAVRRMAGLLSEAGCDVIGPVDSRMDDLFNVHYMLFCQEEYARLFSYIRSLKRYSLFIAEGEVLRNLEMICTSKPDCLVMDGNLDLDRAKRICNEYGVTLASELHTIQKCGTEEKDDRISLARLLAKVDASKNFLLTLNGDMPCSLKKELHGYCLKEQESKLSARP